MHADELQIDERLVRGLLAEQFPEGTDNALFRLGEEMVARLPRLDHTVATLEKERRWLPKLAPHLPLAVPSPVAEGSGRARFRRGRGAVRRRLLRSSRA